MECPQDLEAREIISDHYTNLNFLIFHYGLPVDDIKTINFHMKRHRRANLTC